MYYNEILILSLHKRFIYLLILSHCLMHALLQYLPININSMFIKLIINYL